jgi:hypothetical protein
MRDPIPSGICCRYLLDGPHAERFVTIEIERAAIVAVVCNETGEELPVECVGRRDFDYAMEAIK